MFSHDTMDLERKGDNVDILLDELIGDSVRIVPMERYHVQDLYEIGNEHDIWTHLPKVINTLDDM